MRYQESIEQYYALYLTIAATMLFFFGLIFMCGYIVIDVSQL